METRSVDVQDAGALAPPCTSASKTVGNIFFLFFEQLFSTLHDAPRGACSSGGGEEEECELDRNNLKKCLTAAVTEKDPRVPPI